MAIVVITGSVSGATMYQPRLEYAMAKDGLWYSRFAEVHPKYNTPSFALMAQAIYAIILVCVSALLRYTTIPTKKPHLVPPHKVWFVLSS